MSEVTRPKANVIRIHSKNEFELCYLRHTYFRKTTDNPSPEEMKPYLNIVRNSSRNTFRVYKNLFGIVGFDVEDIFNVGLVHLVSFLGLFSLQKMPNKYEEFIDFSFNNGGVTPGEKQVLEKNKANFTIFLKQRMENLVRICRQKARNIKGFPTEEFQVYVGSLKPPKIIRNLTNNAQEYGYKKLDLATFKTVRKRAKVPFDTRIFNFAGLWYVCVPVGRSVLGLGDFVGADLDPYDNLHNHTPEQVYFNSQDESYWKVKKKQFHKQTAAEKARQLRSFVAKYEDKPAYSDEIKAAKKLLQKLEI